MLGGIQVLRANALARPESIAVIMIPVRQRPSARIYQECGLTVPDTMLPALTILLPRDLRLGRMGVGGPVGIDETCKDLV